MTHHTRNPKGMSGSVCGVWLFCTAIDTDTILEQCNGCGLYRKVDRSETKMIRNE